MAKNNNRRDSGKLNLSSFLNALDGITTPENIIVIMTANDLSKLDPAIFRDGRCDIKQEVKRLEHSEIIQYLKMCYPDYTVPLDVHFNPVPGAKVHAAFINHKFESEKAIKEIMSEEDKSYLRSYL